MKRYKLLRMNVDSISEEEIYDRILSLSERETPAQVVLLDTYLLMKAKFNRELSQVINSADLVIPISWGIKAGLSILGKKIEKVYNYFNLGIRLLTYLVDHKKNIYILGGNKAASEKSEKNIRDSFPGIRLMGRYPVDYKKEFEPKIITAMQKVDPALVIVSMKRPKQEKWIRQKFTGFNHCVFIGIENFVNILGGKTGSPDEKSYNSASRSFAKLFAGPGRFVLYTLYFISIIFYKLLRLE